MSTLAAALANPPKKKLCGVGAWLDTLPTADQEAAEDAFESTTWQNVDLLEVFKSQGFPGEITILSRHRRGRCSCH